MIVLERSTIMKKLIYLVMLYYVFLTQGLCAQVNGPSELFVQYRNNTNSNYKIGIKPVPNTTIYDKYLNPIVSTDWRYNEQVVDSVRFNACYQGQGTQGEIYPTVCNGTVYYGKYQIRFFDNSTGENLVSLRYIDFRDANYDASANFYLNQDFFLNYDINNSSVYFTHRGISYVDTAYGIWDFEPPLSPDTMRFKNFRYINNSLTPVELTIAPGGTYFVSSFDTLSVALGSFPVWVTAQNRKKWIDLPYPDIYVNFSSWENGVKFDTVRYVNPSLNLTDLRANYVPNFQDCSVSGSSSFTFRSNMTYTASPLIYGPPSYYEYYWYIKYDNDGVWQNLGSGPKEYSFTPVHSSFELKCYLKDKVLNIGVWSSIKRVEYTPLAVTVTGPIAFSSKILMTYTANHQPYSGVTYDWWIKYDFNNTWQRLGGGLQTKSIMSSPYPAYSFYIKCYVKTASDTIGVCSNELRVEYYSFGDPIIANKDSDDETLKSSSAISSDQITESFIGSTDAERWWPVNADILTLKQKIQILIPIKETVKEVTHKFRWKESDPFES